MLQLEVKGDIKEFAPGQTIEGIAGWRMPRPPKNAALRLFWYTEGKSTQDIGITEERAFDAPAASHEESFQLRLPESPYSFSGTLISLRWALELVLDRGKEVKRVDLLVSPWVREPELGTVPEEKDGPCFKLH